MQYDLYDCGIIPEVAEEFFNVAQKLQDYSVPLMLNGIEILNEGYHAVHDLRQLQHMLLLI